MSLVPLVAVSASSALIVGTGTSGIVSMATSYGGGGDAPALVSDLPARGGVSSRDVLLAGDSFFT